MSSVELSDEVLTRLEAEATRRGVSVEAVITEFAAQLSSQPAEDDALEAFIGCGTSGRTDLGRRHREIRAEQTAGLTAADL